MHLAKGVSIAGHPVVVIVVEVAFEYCIQYNILLSDFLYKEFNSTFIGCNCDFIH